MKNEAFWLAEGFRLTLIRWQTVTSVRGDVIGFKVSIDGVIVEGWCHLLDGVRDEDEGDETGEALLSEAGHVFDDVTGVCGHQKQTLKTRVKTDPQPELHVVNVIVSEHNTRSDLHTAFVFTTVFNKQYKSSSGTQNYSVSEGLKQTIC